jgi:SAM-dependent methyltransferase
VPVDPANADAARAWNGNDGDHWVEHADRYDRSIARYHRALLAAAAIAPGHRVLDIGCGNGQTTRDAARAAASGEALGVDVSAQLVANARRLAQAEGLTNARFVQADAQIHPFEPRSFDVAISRTGAMFFGDPVAAFSNVGRALRDGGRLAMMVWQHQSRNEWFSEFSTALLAGRTPPSPPDGYAPGPFSLGDPARVRRILTDAGFDGVECEGASEPMYFGDDADSAYAFVCSLGFSKWMLDSLDDAGRRRALDALRRTIDAHDTGTGVLYESAAWIVTARRG